MILLINDHIGLGFIVTKHFDELIERVTTFFDNYSTIFNQFMDCVISLHECRVFTSHPSLTYRHNHHNENSVHLYNFSRALSYDDFYDILKKAYSKEHNYVKLYPRLEKYFFVFLVDDFQISIPLNFRVVFYKNVFAYLKSKNYRVD